jgi:phosphate-selective porin OprO/OprP
MMSRLPCLPLAFALLLLCLVPRASWCLPQAGGATPQAKPVDVAVADDGVMVWSTPDGAFRGSVEGRVQLDSAFYVGGTRPLSNGAEIRRARIGFRLRFWQRWDAKVDVDFADNQTAVKDLWISYALSARSAIKAGQFTEPFNLEQITSSRYSTFIERALIAGLAPDRHVGVALDRRAPRWQATAGVFGQSVGQRDVSGDDQGFDVTGRVTGLPLASRGNRRIIHVGVAGSYRTPPAASLASLADHGDLRLRLLPETHVSRVTFVDSGTIHGVQHFTMLGLEAAAVAGPVSLQAEWNGEWLSRTAPGRRVGFSGWYAFASWFPTGDHRPYRAESADFGRVRPRSRRGALELAARYSTVSLNDLAGDVRGGRERIVTAGANWYFNPNLRLMINASRVENDRFASGAGLHPPGGRFGVLQARLALAY